MREARSGALKTPSSSRPAPLSSGVFSMNPENRYIDLLNIDDEAAVLQVIKKLASQLSDHEHLIRSCIFDLHAAVETDLRRIFFLHFQPLLFLTSDEVENRGVKQQF